MEWVSLAISIGALLISVINFIRYDKKIKAQNLIINQYQIQQIEEKKRINNSAKISGSLIKGNNGVYKLVISNEGLAPARNVNINDIRKIKGVLMTGGLIFPHPLLNPGEKIVIPFMTSDSTPEIMNLTYKWDDNNKVENRYNQNLQL